MEITLASSPEVNTYMSDRIKVADYHAIYINFWKLEQINLNLKISRLTLSPYYPNYIAWQYLCSDNITASVYLLVHFYICNWIKITSYRF